MLLFCLMTVVAVSADENPYVLNEGFESGKLPDGWTQEYVAGQQNWTIEATAAAQNPTGAYEGNYRIVLKNNTNMTIGFTTRLVSPVMNLKTKVLPILTFAHAQAQRMGDFENLRVLYRTKATDQWLELKKFDKKITSWQLDTINLPNTTLSDTYQIAFEVTDNMGYGVALDNIVVRSLPTCDAPSNFTFSEIGAQSVAFAWAASFDALTFDVVASTNELTDVENETNGVVYRETIVEDNVVISGLTANTTYYIYVRATCAAGPTEWVKTTVQTRNVIAIPYSNAFDYSYVANSYKQEINWVYGNSIDQTLALPFINQCTGTTYLARYTLPNSVGTNTTVMAFVGGTKLTGGLFTEYVPVGQYVYVATPELGVDDMKTVEVSFWGTAADMFSADSKNALIVGVMTDPANIATFEPVDTVYAHAKYISERYIVSLKNYTGSGKYLAFASKFTDKKNAFFMDNLNIQTAPVAPQPASVKVKNMTPTQFVVNPDLRGATTWNLAIAEQNVQNSAACEPVNPIFTKNGITTADYTVQMTNWSGKSITVFVQSVNGDAVSPWTASQRYQVPMAIAQADLPFVTSFEPSEGDSYSIVDISNFVNWRSSTTTKHVKFITFPKENYTVSEQTEVPAGMMGGNGPVWDGHYVLRVYDDSYLVFPYVENASKMKMSFFAMAQTRGGQAVECEYGVMTDPYDVSTFVKTATFHAPDYNEMAEMGGTTDGYEQFVTTFDNYTGQGHYLAIHANKWNAAPSKFMSMDLLRIEEMSDCMEATGFSAEMTNTTAKLSWAANGAKKWQLIVKYEETEVVNQTLTTPSYTVTGLKPHTNYTYTVATYCGEEPVSSPIMTFKTDCSEFEALPYLETFNNFKTTDNSRELPPDCWTIAFENRSGYYYPYINISPSSSAYNHSQFGALYISSTTKPLQMALPLFEEQDVSKLQMDFWLYTSNETYRDTIWVGVMSDPNDMSTFDTVAPIAHNGLKAYKQYFVSFADYKGKGKYIAFTKVASNQSFYIDDVHVERIGACATPLNLRMTAKTDKGASIKWDDAHASSYNVMVLNTTNIDLTKVSPDASQLVWSGSSNTNSITFADATKFTGNTTYYVYVQSACSASEKSGWSQPFTFTTACSDVVVPEAGMVENFANANVLGCWTTGTKIGTATITIQNGYLYIQHVATTENAYAILPPMDINSIKDYEISFDAHAGTGQAASYAKTISVGVAYNTEDMSSWSIIDKFTLPVCAAATTVDNYGFDWAQRFTVRFNNYTGDDEGNYGKRIFFMTESGGLQDYVYIDNVIVQKVETNKCPLSIKVSDVTANSAKATWETGLGNKFDVKVATTKVAADQVDALTAVFTQTVTANNVDITGLEGTKNYYIYVRNADAANTRWSAPVRFRTLCPAEVDLPYSNNFDDVIASTVSGSYIVPEGWANYSSGTSAVSNGYGRIYATAKHSGINGLYAYSTPTKDTYMVLPAIKVSPATTTLSFWAKSSATTGFRTLAIGVTTTQSSYDDMVAACVWVDTIKVQGTTYTEFITEKLSNYSGNGKHIVIRMFGGNNTSTSAAYAYIDDILVEASSNCFKPTNVAFVGADSHEITFKWDGNYDEYECTYVEAGSGAAVGTNPITKVTGKQATIKDLKSSTDYDLYVRTYCNAENQSSWVGPFQAATLFTYAPADAHWNFDDQTMWVANTANASIQKIQRGWIAGNADASKVAEADFPRLMVNNAVTEMGKQGERYAKSGVASVMVGNNGFNSQYLVMPLIEGNTDNLQLRFNARNISTYTKVNSDVDSTYNTLWSALSDRTMEIGTVTNPYDLSTFELLDTYQGPKNIQSALVEGNYWEEVVVSLYGCTGKYICFRVNNAQSGTFIDDVVVEEEVCGKPTALRHNPATITTKHIDLSWRSGAAKWNVTLVTADDNKQVFTKEVTTSTLAIDDLVPGTDYIFYVVGDCGGGNKSAMAKYEFTTPCEKILASEASWNFNGEDAIELYGYDDNFGTTPYYRPACWLNGLRYGNKIADRYAFVAQNGANSAPYEYSRMSKGSVNDGAGKRLQALEFDASPYSYGAYVIMPELGFNLDTMMLHFYARLGHVDLNTGLYSANTANYPTDIHIGYVTDADINTFVELDVVNVTLSVNATAGETNIKSRDDEYWDDIAVPLAKYQGDRRRIAIMYCTQAMAAGSASAYLYIDDVEIIPETSCTAVMSQMGEVTANTATINWSATGQQQFALQVSEDANFNTFVVNDTLKNVTTATVSGLKPGTIYYYQIRHLCERGEVSEWAGASFQTAFVVRYHEDFTNATGMYPDGWYRYHKTTVEQAFKGEALVNCPVNNIAAWHVDNTENSIMYKGHMVTTHENWQSGFVDNHKMWLVSPIIDLTGNTDSIALSFNLAVCSGSDNNKPLLMEDGTDAFYVIISEDGGATWKEANATSWTRDGKGDYDYTEIPYTYGGGKYNINMTQYNGKRVKVAFYSQMADDIAYNHIHLGNVQINRVTTKSYAATVCPWMDFEDENFFVDADQLHEGKQTFSRYEVSNSDAEADKFLNVEINVLPETKTVLEESVCQNTNFDKYGFKLNPTASCVLKQKLAGTECDSLVELHLTVNPVQEVTRTATICQGMTYEFHGQQLYQSDVYRYTLTSAAGCDSVDVLVLTVTEMMVSNDDVYLCENNTLQVGDTTIATAGKYSIKLKNAAGCDSLVNLTVTMASPATEVKHTIICAGETYSDDLFKGLSTAGKYTSLQGQLLTEHGCDSTVVLNLYVADSEGHVQINISANELPLVVNGEELLPTGTPDGYYEKPINVGTCGEVIAQITVGEKSGLNNVSGHTQLQKVIYHDQVYVIKNGTWYNVLGEEVPAQW